MEEKQTSIKLSSTNESEIFSIHLLLSEIAALARDLEICRLEDINLSHDDYPILSRMLEDSDKDSIVESFLDGLCDKIRELPFEKVCLICYTLFDNVCDAEAETLEYRQELKEALEVAGPFDESEIEEQFTFDRAVFLMRKGYKVSRSHKNHDHIYYFISDDKKLRYRVKGNITFYSAVFADDEILADDWVVYDGE